MFISLCNVLFSVLVIIIVIHVIYMYMYLVIIIVIHVIYMYMYLVIIIVIHVHVILFRLAELEAGQKDITEFEKWHDEMIQVWLPMDT